MYFECIREASLLPLAESPRWTPSNEDRPTWVGTRSVTNLKFHIQVPVLHFNRKANVLNSINQNPHLAASWSTLLPMQEETTDWPTYENDNMWKKGDIKAESPANQNSNLLFLRRKLTSVARKWHPTEKARGAERRNKSKETEKRPNQEHALGCRSQGIIRFPSMMI